MNSSREEKRLVKLSIKGDKRALEVLLTKYLNFCFSISITLLEDQKLAEKAIENTFREVSENIKDLYDPTGFLVWMYDILKKNISLLKPKGKEIKTSYYDENLQETQINYSTIVATEPEEKKALGRLLEKIRSFDEKEKEIFAMMDFEGLNANEVSVIIGIEPMEVRRLLYRVKRELKQVFLENRAGLFTITPLPNINLSNNIENSNLEFEKIPPPINMLEEKNFVSSEHENENVSIFNTNKENEAL